MSQNPPTQADLDAAYLKGLSVGKDAERLKHAGRRSSTPGRVHIGYAAPSGDTGQVWKVLVLVEMVALYAAAVKVNQGDQPALAWIVGKDGMKRLSAVVAVLVLLILLADVGLGLAAATFGAIVLFSYLSTRGRPAIGRLAPH